MNIVVIGAGDVGMLMAADFAHNSQNSVTLITAHPQTDSTTLSVYNPDETLAFKANIAALTSDYDAIAQADVVFITHPTFMLEQTAQRILPYVHPGLWIGVVPGAMGEFYFQQHLAKGARLVGLQRVHAVARLHDETNSVYALGRKPELFIAALPARYTQQAQEMCEYLFNMPVKALPTYLVETLTPSNPILHTSRLFSLFKDWQPGVTYPENILFYEGWTDDASETLIAADAEVQALCRTIEERSGLNLCDVRSLKDHYESPTAAAMTYKISHIPAFAGLTSPMKPAQCLSDSNNKTETEQGECTSCAWIPDFSSRYFVADFAYGMKAIIDIARLMDVPTPTIDTMWNWYVQTAQPDHMIDALPADPAAFIALYQDEHFEQLHACAQTENQAL